jgi:hypothetical protein
MSICSSEGDETTRVVGEGQMTKAFISLPHPPEALGFFAAYIEKPRKLWNDDEWGRERFYADLCGQEWISGRTVQR